MPFRGEKRDTTVGRLLFNEIFPEDFPFQDEAMTKKKLDRVMALVYQKYGQAKTAEIADDLKDLGFEYATKSGLSMGMGDFRDLKGLKDYRCTLVKKLPKLANSIRSRLHYQ